MKQKPGRWIAAISLLFVLASAVAVGNDWPQFRGRGGTATAENVGLPIQWTATDNIRWKAKLPGRGVSSPIVIGSRVFVTASSGYRQDRLHLLCFDVATGRKLWHRQFWATGRTTSHPKTCMAAPTPVGDDRRVFALFATGDLAAFDRDGNLLWYRSLVGDYPTISNQVGMAASPILCDGVLIVPMESVGESFVAGIDPQTGVNLWKVDRRRDINWVTPFHFHDGGRSVVLVQSEDVLTAYQPKTGKALWSYRSKGLSTIPSPIAAEGLILVPGLPFRALKPSPDGKAPQELWSSNRLRTSFGTPLCYRGRVYTINSGGILSCAELEKGDLVSRLRLPGPFSASPVAADGKLYLVNEEGTTCVVAVGKPMKLLAKNPLDETILATPAITRGALLLRSDAHLWCIAKNGKE